MKVLYLRPDLLHKPQVDSSGDESSDNDCEDEGLQPTKLLWQFIFSFSCGNQFTIFQTMQ